MQKTEELLTRWIHPLHDLRTLSYVYGKRSVGAVGSNRVRGDHSRCSEALSADPHLGQGGGRAQ